MTLGAALEELARRERLVWLGLMSGTSGDGIDVARVELRERAGRLPEVLGITGRTFPFATERARRLFADLRSLPDAETVARWDAELGEAFADAALAAGDALGPVDAIAVSGHTFAHLPADRPRSTLQVGNAARVASLTGLPAVYGFRAADVARGGEGAPLVPAGDRVLFGAVDHAVAVVNIGGISNLTWLPPGGADPAAADCGPGNLVLDHMVRLASDGAECLDVDGRRAAVGRVDAERLAAWLGDATFAAFFRGSGPRSTGRELFGERWVESQWDALAPLALEDRLATAVEWIARAIAGVLERLAAGHVPGRILLGGGGVHNRALLAALARRLPVLPEVLDAGRHGVDADLREAAAFAILGHELLHGRPGSFPGTTGCSVPGPLGSVVGP